MNHNIFRNIIAKSKNFCFTTGKLPLILVKSVADMHDKVSNHIHNKKNNLNLAATAWSFALIGLAIRLKDITNRDFWYDEAYTGLLIRSNWQDFYNNLLKDTHPPIYYGLLKIFSDISFYFDPTIEKDYIIRIFSIIFGVAIIPLSYYFLKIVLDHLKSANSSRNKFVLFMTPLVLALSPFFVAYSVEGRAYSFTAFLTLALCTIFAYSFKSKPAQYSLGWLYYSLICTTLIFTHYISFFAIASLNIFYIYKFIKTNKYNIFTEFAKYLKFGVHLLTIHLIPIISFGLWFPSFMIQNSHPGSTAWIPKSEFYFIPKSIYAFLFGVDAHALGVPNSFAILPKISLESVAFMIYSLMLIAACVAYKKFNQKEREAFISCLFMSAVPITINILASLFGVNFYVERYFIGYAIFLIISMLIVISKLNVNWQFGLSLLYLASVMFIYNTVQYKPNGYKEVTNILAENKKVKLIFTDPFEFTIAKYYANQYEDRILFSELDTRWNSKDWEQINQANVLKAKNTRLNKDNILVTTADINYLRDVSGIRNLNGLAGARSSKEIGTFRLYDSTVNYANTKPKTPKSVL